MRVLRVRTGAAVKVRRAAYESRSSVPSPSTTATGAVLRPATMCRYATEAGFSKVTVLDRIEHDEFHFNRLDP